MYFTEQGREPEFPTVQYNAEQFLYWIFNLQINYTVENNKFAKSYEKLDIEGDSLSKSKANLKGITLGNIDLTSAGYDASIIVVLYDVKYIWHIDQTSRIWVTEFYQQDYEGKYFASLFFNVLLAIILVISVILIILKKKKERDFVLLGTEDDLEDENLIN